MLEAFGLVPCASPGLRCQVTDVVSSDSSHMLVVARHRDTCQLTLWQLSITRQDALEFLCMQCSRVSHGRSDQIACRIGIGIGMLSGAALYHESKFIQARLRKLSLVPGLR